MVFTLEEHQLTFDVIVHKRVASTSLSRITGRLNRSAEEVLKEVHREGLRMADVKLPGGFPGTQPCVE